MLEGFSPYHLVDEFSWIIRNEESLATYHIVHRAVGHYEPYEPCIPYDQVCEQSVQLNQGPNLLKPTTATTIQRTMSKLMPQCRTALMECNYV